MSNEKLTSVNEDTKGFEFNFSETERRIYGLFAQTNPDENNFEEEFKKFAKKMNLNMYPAINEVHQQLVKLKSSPNSNNKMIFVLDSLSSLKKP